MKTLRLLLQTLMVITLATCATQPVPEKLAPVDAAWTVIPETGKIMRWDPKALPLVIYVHPSAAVWLYHIQKAADVWNRRLGFTMFKVSTVLHPEAPAFLEESPGIIPIMGFERDPKRCDVPQAPMERCNPMTSSRAPRSTGMVRASSVWMPMDLDLALTPDAYLIVVHELGHVMGLTHDEQHARDGAKPWSIMEPMLDFDAIEDTPPPVTEADIKRLQDWYLRKGDEWTRTATATST